MHAKNTIIGITLSGALWGLGHAADTGIAVQYRDKPPYSYTKDAKPAGFLLERTVEIFKRANLTAIFEEAPVKRITQNVQMNANAVCSPGWYKLPERELFANPELKLGKVSGASYGGELDSMISATTQTVMDSTVTPLGMAKMIKFKRADYMLIDEEDYSFLNQQGEVDAADVKPLRYADMPPGLKRYIMCSKSVGADAMERINAAIRQMALPVKP